MVYALKQESSKKTDVDSQIKGFPRDKEPFVSRRRISFPKELFIELRLSKRQVLKVREWEKDGHSIVPMWFANLERVLFVDQDLFDEWIREKGKR